MRARRTRARRLALTVATLVGALAAITVAPGLGSLRGASPIAHRAAGLGEGPPARTPAAERSEAVAATAPRQDDAELHLLASWPGRYAGVAALGDQVWARTPEGEAVGFDAEDAAAPRELGRIERRDGDGARIPILALDAAEASGLWLGYGPEGPQRAGSAWRHPLDPAGAGAGEEVAGFGAEIEGALAAVDGRALFALANDRFQSGRSLQILAPRGAGAGHGPAGVLVGATLLPGRPYESRRAWLLGARLDGFDLWDLSDPARPRELGAWTGPRWLPGAVVLDGELAVLSAGAALRVFDLADPSAPAERGRLEDLPEVVDLRPAAPPLAGMLFALTPSGLTAVDLRNPDRPRVLGRLEADWPAARALALAEGRAYVADEKAGLHAIAIPRAWPEASPIPPPDATLTPGPTPPPAFLPRLDASR